MDATIAALVSTLGALHDSMASLEEQMSAEKMLQAEKHAEIGALRSSAPFELLSSAFFALPWFLQSASCLRRAAAAGGSGLSPVVL